MGIAWKLEEQLKREGISGTALRVNVPATREWQEALAHLRHGYLKELESLKNRLKTQR